VPRRFSELASRASKEAHKLVVGEPGLAQDRAENTALYVGPVVTYTRDKWWATLSVMPQVYGANFQDNPDGNTHLDLEGHERVNVRLIFGLNF